METRIRFIDPETWKRFKLVCLMEGMSMNSKLLELITAAVETTDDEHRQLQEAFSKGLKKLGKK